MINRVSKKLLYQWFSTRVPPEVTQILFILLIQLNAVFCVTQLNYCTGVSRGTEMFPWGSAPAKKVGNQVKAFIP